MRNYKIIASLASLIFLIHCKATAAERDAFSGNANYQGCEAAAGSNNNLGVGSGYCLGVIEATSFLMEVILSCVPATVTVGQEAKVVFKYMQNNPEKLNQRLDVLVSQALTAAWPCPKK